ncbi:ralbp1-associated eps domain-containing protein 1, partial [Plakobranchus ocellatus]
WTAFKPESPGSSGVSSPAHLANFEFATPSADPESKIVHPVAMHVMPEGGASPAEGMDRGRAFSDSAVVPEAGEASPRLMKQRSHTESYAAAPAGEPSQLPDTPVSSGGGRDLSKYNAPIHGRPRPKKNASVPAAVRGQLPPPMAGPEGGGGPGDAVVSGNQAPPTPPPRPPHGRSMSVDVKSASQLNAPAVPPRVSPKDAQSALKISEAPNTSVAAENLVPPSTPDANQEPSQAVSVGNEEVAEDDDTPDNAIKERLQTKPAATALRQLSRDRRDIHMAVRTHKERNTMLTRLNSELNQELQEVMEQRIALEIQLEHLRPFSS